MQDKLFKPDAFYICTLMDGTTMGNDGYANAYRVENDIAFFYNLQDLENTHIDMELQLFAVPVHNIAYITRVVCNK